MDLIDPIDYSRVFDCAGVALLVADVSDAEDALRALRPGAPEELASALRDDLELAGRIASKVRILAANATALELYGAGSPSDLFGVLDRLFVSESLASFGRLAAELACGRRRASVRGLNARLGGDPFDAEVTVTLLGNRGPHRRAVVAVRDISEQVRADEAAAAANDFLDAVIDHVPDMLFVKDAEELRFVRLNRAGEELLGIPREQMLGKNDHDFFPAEQADAFIARDRAVLGSGRMHDIEEEPIDTAHGRRWLHTKKVPIVATDGSPAYLLGISEDVTILRDVRRQLAARSRDLERSNRELQQFAYVASHDLNEPLRTIRGFAEILEEQLAPELGGRVAEMLGFLKSGAERMSAMIAALLELSRLGAKAHDIEEVATEALVDAVWRGLAVAVEEAGATLDRAELPTVPCDGDLIAHVFQNLLANALKFRDPERRLIIEIEAIEQEEQWRFEVRDNGIGFDDRFADRIFQVFQRLHARGRYQGAGIGLSICKRIVVDHGGGIGATGAPGEGATFWFTLPKSR